MPTYELVAYLTCWALSMPYLFSPGDCCGVLSCGNCSGTTPATLTVTFADVANDGCTDCTDFNTGSYVCDPEIPFGAADV